MPLDQGKNLGGTFSPKKNATETVLDILTKPLSKENELPKDLLKIVKRARKARTAREAVSMIRNAVYSFSYDLSIIDDPEHQKIMKNIQKKDANVDAYLPLLYKRRSGICGDLATVYTDLLRHAGIPTFFANGAVAKEKLVTTNHLHAWVKPILLDEKDNLFLGTEEAVNGGMETVLRAQQEMEEIKEIASTDSILEEDEPYKFTLNAKELPVDVQHDFAHWTQELHMSKEVNDNMENFKKFRNYLKDELAINALIEDVICVAQFIRFIIEKTDIEKVGLRIAALRENPMEYIQSLKPGQLGLGHLLVECGSISLKNIDAINSLLKKHHQALKASEEKLLSSIVKRQTAYANNAKANIQLESIDLNEIFPSVDET